MYEAYYGLRERPFDLSPNPRFVFLSNQHRTALAHLKYGLSGRPGLTVLTGEAGTGKTTLVKTALRSVEGPGAQIVHVSNPTLTREEFYEYLAVGFGFTAAARTSKAQFLRDLEQALTTCVRHSVVLALIVDEAQSLPHQILEEIRLLTNVETSDGKALAVILVGQSELTVQLNDVTLRQLKQRIALRCELNPLNLSETAAYIATRVRVAGGVGEQLFTADAVRAIFQFSRGIPRTIGVICDNALVNGFAVDQKPVTRELILEVCADFHLGAAPAPEVVERATPVGSHREQVAVAAPELVVNGRKLPESPSADTQPEAASPPARQSLFGQFAPRRRFSFFS